MPSCFIFKSLSHFEFIFVHGEKFMFQHHLFTCGCSTFLTPLAEEIFFHCIFLPPLSKTD